MILNRFQSVSECFHDSHSLKKNLGKLLKYWAAHVRLEIHPIPVLLPLENTRVCQLSQLTLETRWPQTQMARQLYQVPGALGLKQRGSQDLLLCLADQGIQERRRTQHTYYYTHNTYLV